MAFKKKLYKFRPKEKEEIIEIQSGKEQKKEIAATTVTVERDVREMLANKISGTHIGLWLLLPEHLRLGTWDLLMAWTGSANGNAIEPRLALQMVHESALCVTGLRGRRTLRQKGFETLNGLPFVATDVAIHRLLTQHCVKEAEALQIALGQLRYQWGHYPGDSILLDPHRILTWSKRQMQPRKTSQSSTHHKQMQTFFVVDGQSWQPLTFSMGSSSVTTSQATISVLKRIAQIFPRQTLVIGDGEHFTEEILSHLTNSQQFSLLIPAPRYKGIMQQAASMDYTPQWAGYGVARGKYKFSKPEKEIDLIVQRTGETQENYEYKPFVTTSPESGADLMTRFFPERWNIEEFFRTESMLGWNRASTLNLNIRFGRLSMALIAQAAIFEFRKKMQNKIKNWTAESLAQKLFTGIDGDLRVKGDKIMVTLYNAPEPELLKKHYVNLPEKLAAEGINPRIPWLYNFKVDFRFK